MNIPKDLVAASATPMVLAILVENENYGYAIIKRVRELSQDSLRWTDGMLYPVLHRLERQGLIESAWRGVSAKRRRRYYRLTGAGIKALEQQKKQWELVNEALRSVWGRVATVTGSAKEVLCLI